MRRILVVVSLLITLVVIAKADTQVTFAWTESSFPAPAGGVGLSVCPSTSPSNCISGWNLYNVAPSGTQTKVGTLAASGTPTSATVWTLVVSPYPYLGADNLVATTLYYDQSGNAGETVASTAASFLYTPAPPVLAHPVPQ